ncbi:hypothetical protein GLOIN_2v1721549 [Rhizophagus irregularis DAOM 181602=DAOM 197198]|uniref:Uncharacterized protein n=1 Tax=Rhizophagus irregularis (strain DAOM 181602 / DAOM 197198 / MUCL 43194) TaxID=747089 RepID=A0A2P4P2A6_RHIID|nr:hypothetical protein GLOIN_2v1721549 [Rhizophagus irregularis DAOM 181602=DAOM 197198]POG59511.1 hypothetical protein GLOIN_2v1721549 [Rhizophagus irregularis DAOM 181602=DAOM 197198]|eukprot:XP_025166377.1 hypothetical protein GLOIN_2v1721549 [Rhizophagus irregularis DAOM 181602=DAOM 197198]
MEIGILHIINLLMKNFVKKMDFGTKIGTKNIILNLFQQHSQLHLLILNSLITPPILTIKNLMIINFL